MSFLDILYAYGQINSQEQQNVCDVALCSLLIYLFYINVLIYLFYVQNQALLEINFTVLRTVTKKDP